MASSLSLLPALLKAAPQLSRRFFTCRACSQWQLTTNNRLIFGTQAHIKSFRRPPQLQSWRFQFTSATATHSPPSLAALRKQFSKTAARIKTLRFLVTVKGWFPTTSHSVVAYWLLGSAASVFGIVVFGGLTRLTESGLSITEWRPVTGSLPPLSQDDWQSEFDKYRASPEFQQLNPNMDLSEFKKIYWMEWIHRFWGRIVGLTTLAPTIYFIARRQVSGPIARNLILINLLIGLQGVVGWWMVKSGLKDDLFAKGSHPRVSQYRLATHLGLAFTVYTSMLWNGLQILRENSMTPNTKIERYRSRAAQLLKRLGSPRLALFRYGTFAVAALVGTTALGGALVAGLDAGLIYNEFPYMGLGLTPPKSELFNDFYSRRPGDLWWRNMLENPSLVQLDHRILATTTFVAVHALWAYARFSPAVRVGLPKGAWTALNATLGLVWLQVTLGITTLLYLVPVPLAAAHQAGSLALLTGVVVLGSRVWTPPRLARLVESMGEVRKNPVHFYFVDGPLNPVGGKPVGVKPVGVKPVRGKPVGVKPLGVKPVRIRQVKARDVVQMGVSSNKAHAQSLYIQHRRRNTKPRHRKGLPSEELPPRRTAIRRVAMRKHKSR